MLPLLDPTRPDAPFPAVDEALDEPDGLLAVGGDLSTERLLNAYRQGIFPWYSDGQPILWWCPDPRTVLFPENLKVSRSLAKVIRNKGFKVSVDRDFSSVINACSEPRDDGLGTWITAEMMAAYIDMHRQGHAHSVEVWHETDLVGGLYGIAIGKVFFGESMFSRERDASKVALVHLSARLQEWGYRLIDCQVYTSHLLSLGAEEISRAQFCSHLEGLCSDNSISSTAWTDADLSRPEVP
ncbi:MAG: leucyl/phenylalanyl-tRNA--protein transferase [Candidatus Sedimenticola sp. 6PFRAG7]